MRLKTSDNPRIKRLDVGCQTGLKVDESYALWSVVYFMACKVVQCKRNFTVLALQFDIPLDNPPKEQVSE